MRIRFAGHQVEDVSDRLQRGGQDVEGHLVEPRGVGLLGEAEALPHGGERHPVDVVDRRRPGQSRQGPGAQVGVGSVAGRREVVDVLVVAGDPQIGRSDRTQLNQRVEIVVGDVVDVGGGARLVRACVSGHSWNVPQPAVCSGPDGRFDL